MTDSYIVFKDTAGVVHTINKDSGKVIRSCIPGNVTSVTGAPLCVFEREV